MVTVKKKIIQPQLSRRGNYYFTIKCLHHLHKLINLPNFTLDLLTFFEIIEFAIIWQNLSESISENELPRKFQDFLHLTINVFAFQQRLTSWNRHMCLVYAEEISHELRGAVFLTIASLRRELVYLTLNAGCIYDIIVVIWFIIPFEEISIYFPCGQCWDASKSTAIC